ncbi:MAG: ABC transporter ATP-binding protein [Desulfonatronovibrio sp. MSAO_Bac4]|nr:MAG: ABC transporter ATP-binding protein [Desulfonatronovibrio sp. MSAO_Bac4]
MIKANKLKKTYIRGAEEVYALRGIDLDIQEGSFVAILGPSGSGKSTCLQLLGCLDHPTSGYLNIDGYQTSSLTNSETESVRRNKIGFVFQHFHLISSLSVQENIVLPLLFARKRPDYNYLNHLLKMVGLRHREKHLPDQLSGGEMQRVAVARALINQPRIILADEPTGNLDTENSAKIFELLEELNAQGVTVIFVTHNQELAKRAACRIMFLDGLIQHVE